nr:ACP S-malonyltransferase [Pseudenhygromyxa sp. WMMC2535]
MVLMFPGQSSRYPGMFEKLVELHRPNAELLRWASELLGRDLAAHYAVDAGEQAFERNVDVQVGVFLANHMYLRALEAMGVHAGRSLGLSLGEWNHLVHIGALSFEDALRAVEVRGRCYDEGPRGWMAAVQPIAEDELREVVERASSFGVVEIVNLNSPRQQVIAGERAAVEAAIELVEDEHYAQTHIIDRNVPMHSSLFEPVGERFATYLRGLCFAAPKRPYLPNRIGRPLASPTQADFVELLSSHVCAPVRWRASIEHIAVACPEAVFVEVGPKAVLSNLMHRKWLSNRKLHTDSSEDTAEHFAGVVAELLLHAGAPEPESPLVREPDHNRQELSACTAR